MKKKTTKPNKSVSKELTQHFIQTVDKCFFPPSTDFGLELWFLDGKLECFIWDKMKTIV